MSRSTTDPAIDDGHQRAVSALPAVPALETRLTLEYGIRHQFVGAGMGFIAHERLAAAVSNAGGLGVLGASPDPADSVPVMVERLRALTSGPFGVDQVDLIPKQDSAGQHRPAYRRVRPAGRTAGGISP